MAKKISDFHDELLKIFLYKRSASFTDLADSLRVPSNKLSYHLNKLVQREVLEKIGNRYTLTESSRLFLPYFDSLLNRSKYPLVVVKVDVVMKGKHLLVFRKKEPFLGFWEVPATKLRLGESVDEAVRRVLGKVHEKARMSAPIAVREKILSQSEVIYDYFLYFVTIQLSSSKEIKAMGEFLLRREWDKMRLIPTDKLFLQGKIRKDAEVKLNLDRDELKVQTA